jgi:hypothetical protein
MTGSNKTTTTASNAPWSGAQPALNTALTDAQKLYKNGTGAGVFTDSTVIPWDQKTVQGQGVITDAANANSGGNGLSNQYQGIINSGGYNNAQQDALKNTQNVANSSFNLDSNPAFQQVLKAQQDAASNSVNASASGAGRYGSGIHQQTLANTIGDLTNRAVSGEYQNWQNRKDAANSNLFNMGQTGVGNIGTAYQGLQAPAQSLMQVGAMQEDLATRQMNDKLRIFNDQQQKPWENLSRLNAIASGAGQLGGSQTTSQPGQNPFLSALGYGATGAGLLGSLF